MASVSNEYLSVIITFLMENDFRVPNPSLYLLTSSKHSHSFVHSIAKASIVSKLESGREVMAIRE